MHVPDILRIESKGLRSVKKPLSKFGEFLPVISEGMSYQVFHSTQQTSNDHVDLSMSSRKIDEVDYMDMQTLVFKEKIPKVSISFSNRI